MATSVTPSKPKLHFARPLEWSVQVDLDPSEVFERTYGAEPTWNTNRTMAGKPMRVLSVIARRQYLGPTRDTVRISWHGLNIRKDGSEGSTRLGEEVTLEEVRERAPGTYLALQSAIRDLIYELDHQADEAIKVARTVVPA